MHDLKISGARIISVITGEEWASDILIDGAVITDLPGPGSSAQAKREIDAAGSFAVPGFIDAHMHIESSFLTPSSFATATLPRGTTTILADPHEVVNVAGEDAMHWMIEEGRRTQQGMFWAVPSCVPSLDGLETAGASLAPEDIERMLDLDGVIALGEVMDYRAVVAGGKRMARTLEVAGRRGVIIDGHCPDLAGDELQRYFAAGIDSDHCKNSLEAFSQKLRLGMTMMLQEKSFTSEIVAHLTRFESVPDFCIVSDDIAADAIERDGHLDHLGRVARRAGLPIISILRALTINPARRLRLTDRGVISPGRRADIVLLDDLEQFSVAEVIVGGESVREQPAPSMAFTDSIIVDEASASDLTWSTDLPDGDHVFRTIRVNEVDTSTREEELVLPVSGGRVFWEGRCARVTVMERHEGSGRVVHAPVSGMEVLPGAVATSYAHDSHNISIIASKQRYAEAALARVVSLGGGIVLRTEAAEAEIALPIAGVMTPAPVGAVAEATRRIRKGLESWGWRHRIPFMSISTLTLPVSPALKISDVGLIDVLERRLVSSVVRDEQAD